MRDQRDGGTFRSSHDGRFDQALAALALSESYGLTGSDLFKVTAQNAIEGLLRMQGRDGSWGGSLPTVWAAEALFSAQISGLEGHPQANQFLLRSFRTPPYGPDPREMCAKILLERNKEDPSLAAGADLLLRNKPRWEDQDFSYWYHGSMALFQYDGPSGPKWKSWNEDMKNTIVKSQLRDGTWPGGTVSSTVVRTSLGQLTLEVYYRMANVFGDK